MWWEFDIREFYVTILTSIIAGIIFLLRTIFTNKTQIDELKRTLVHLEKSREERDKELDEQLREIRHDIKNLLQRR